MSEQPHGGSTGRWLKRITQSMSGEPRDLAELVENLREASERGLFDGDALVMLEGVLAVADMQVRDIMVPRSQMVFVERDESPEKLVELVVESGHSRFPVIGEDRDQILGILLAKDLLRLQAAADEDFEIREYMRPVVFVPESKRLNVLLKEFRRSHNHIAMVVDEYGGVCGLVTIEDVIEQIVGEIDDEHDVEDDQTIRKERPREFTVRALTPIANFNQYFSTALFRRRIRHHRRSADAGVRPAAAPRRNHQDRRSGVSHPARRSAPHRSVARDGSLRYRASGRQRVERLNVAMRGPETAQWKQVLARLIAAFAAGASFNLGFAPFGWWPLALAAPAALFALIRGLPPRRAGWTGASFGLGLFAFGTYWLYTCLHVFGLVPVWLTLILQTLLVAAMSLYVAALCYLANRFWLKPGATRDWLVLPALWVLLEWLRGWLLSGFPWLSTGYAMIDSPLAGWAPLLGVYGVTWAAVLISVGGQRCVHAGRAAGATRPWRSVRWRYCLRCPRY